MDTSGGRLLDGHKPVHGDVASSSFGKRRWSHRHHDDSFDETPLLEKSSQENDTDDDDDDVVENLIRNKKELLTMISLMLALFSALCSFAMVAPILPLEVKKYNIRQSTYSQIFATFPLVVFFTCPFVGKLIPRIGPKRCLVLGSLTCALSNAIFGFCDEFDPSQKTYFTVCAFILRATTAIGVSFSETATMTILTTVFQHRMSTAQGVVEVFTGLGLMTGPTVGSALFAASGNSFKVPFLVLAGIMLVCLVLIAIVLPSDAETERASTTENSYDDGQATFGTILRLPGIHALGSSVLVSGILIAFFDTTLADYSLQVEKIYIGLLFICMPATYTFGGLILGKLLDSKVVNARTAIVIGAYCAPILLLFVAPSPLLVLIKKPNLIMTTFTLLVLGFCVSAMLLPVMVGMQNVVNEAGISSSLASNAVISSIFTSMFYMGNIIGSSVGGTLTDILGFKWSSTICADLILCEALGLTFFTIWDMKRKRRHTLLKNTSKDKSLLNGKL